MEERSRDDAAWESAARFVDSLSVRQATRFDDMTKVQARVDRLKSRGRCGMSRAKLLLDTNALIDFPFGSRSMRKHVC